MTEPTETEIAAVSTAPRVTPADIEANIASTWYINAGEGVVADDFQPPVPANHPLRQITICVLILRNGHKIVGVNEGPVSAENFDPAIGRKYARQKAVDQIWPLLGYQLREQLYQRTVPANPPVEA